MIEGDYFTPVAYIILTFLTIVDAFFIHINQLFMVFAFTPLIVYIGCIKSKKIFSADVQPGEIETMKQKDAFLFPVIGSAVLISLYVIFKYINGDIVNILFHIYFTVIGAYSIGYLINEKIYKMEAVKSLAEKHIFTVPKIKYIVDEESKVYLLDIVCFLIGSIPALIYGFTKSWYMNNLLGIVFSIIGIENLMLGELKVALILLVLLFFYDITMVFYTPFMVGVAKNLDGPIKLMFPKKLGKLEKKDFNMIGLGDIVIPGVYVALMFRYDIVKYYRKFKKFQGIKMNYSNFPYFYNTFGGYVLGIFVTLFIMVVFNHAQPALLYLVPGVLITSILTALIKGDVKDALEYNEEKLINELNKPAKDDKKEVPTPDKKTD